MQRTTLTIILLLSSFTTCFAQNDSSATNNFRNRRIALISGSAIFSIGTLLILNEAWYAEYNTGSFHFFDDNKEWLQMDKVGHAYANYQSARLMMDAFKWSGFKKNQQLIYGASLGLAYMTAIECMDGFSKGWGFSWGDQLANTLGTGLALAQHAIWDQQKINLKFSYSSSGLAKYNPSLLGKNTGTQILKDYNGQTYWLTCNPFRFSKKQNAIPKWLQLAVGYSAYGMLGGHENKIIALDNNGNAIKFDRERRYYLSLDIDLTQIKTKNKVLKKVFSYLSILKIPAPALEFSKNKTKFYYFYY